MSLPAPLARDKIPTHTIAALQSDKPAFTVDDTVEKDTITLRFTGYSRPPFGSRPAGRSVRQSVATSYEHSRQGWQHEERTGEGKRIDVQRSNVLNINMKLNTRSKEKRL